MKIRKIAYSVGYTHILTFKEYYRPIIATYFTYELEYGIDNEGTIHENVRLIFRESGFILQFNKEVATLVYEGDIADVKKANPIIEIFFDIIERIKKIPGFTKVLNNKIIVDAVDILDEMDYSFLLTQNKYVYNPFNKLNEFASVLEYHNEEGKEFKLQFGNFNEKDIIKFNLSPLQKKYNDDLKGNVGIYSQFTILETVNNPTFSKVKSLISESEECLKKYLTERNV